VWCSGLVAGNPSSTTDTAAALRAARNQRRCGVQSPPGGWPSTTGTRPHHPDAVVTTNLTFQGMCSSGELVSWTAQPIALCKDNSIRSFVFDLLVRNIGRAVAGSRSAPASTPAASSGFLPIERHGHGIEAACGKSRWKPPSASFNTIPHGPCQPFPCSTSSRSEYSKAAVNTLRSWLALSTPEFQTIQIQPFEIVGFEWP